MTLKIVFNPLTGNFDYVTTPAGHVIEDEGIPLPQRAALNFIGQGVTVTDDVGNDATDVTITQSRVFAYFIS